MSLFRTFRSRALVLGLVVALVAGVAVAGTVTRSEAAHQKTTAATRPTIYMVGSVANNTFWAAVKRGFEDGARQFGMRGIYNAPGQHSSAGSIPIIRAAIAAKPAGIAINYTDKSIEKPTLEALGRRIKVTLFNNNRFEAVKGDSGTATTNPRVTSLPYVGEDSLENAKKLGRAFLGFLKPRAKVLIVDPVPGVQVLALRRQGIQSVLRPKGHATEYLPATLDQARNLTTIGAYLRAHRDIAGIVGLGNPTANPAAEYVKRNNLNIPVASFDVDAGAVALIKQGFMKAATNQQPYLQGYLAALNLRFMINDHLFPLTINTGSYIMTKANIREVEQAVKRGKA
jgi:ABC-type sugar transport system substrate-binding protein